MIDQITFQKNIQRTPSRFRWFILSLRSIVDLAVNIIPYKNSMRKSVLVVRMDKIGDFLLWIDSAKEMRDHYKSIGYHYDLAVNADLGDFARQMDLADKYHFIKIERFRKNLFYRYRVLRKIRRRSYSLVVHPTFSRTRELADAVIHASGASECIGFSGDPINYIAKEKDQADTWYTRLINGDEAPIWDYHKNAFFNATLGIPSNHTTVKELITSNLTPISSPSISAALMAKKYFVIVPGSSWAGRKWPLDRFADIAKRIQEKKGWLCVICGGADEIKQISKLQSLLWGLSILNLTGQTTLMELAWILAHAQLVIGNESAPVHLSSILGVRTVAITGGGHFGRFLPYDTQKNPFDGRPSVSYVQLECFGCNWNCIYSRAKNAPVLCVERVETHNVWKRVCNFLDDSKSC